MQCGNWRQWLMALVLINGAAVAMAQEKSVRPGVNDSFRDPNVADFQERFEVESREVYARREQIVAACQITPGTVVADIGAGTGLFTRLFAKSVGADGRVIAVDIAQKFLDHIQKSAESAGLKNIETVLCTADSTELPPESIDVAFISDTYHHFEFPLKTMTSLQRALKPGGRVIVIDFHRIPGKSTEWALGHVRAGQEVFESEIVQAGFVKTRAVNDLLVENYFVEFTKSASPGLEPQKYPLVAGAGGVIDVADAVDPPLAGVKVVIDTTAGGAPEAVSKGLDRAARILNLYGAAGMSAKDVQLAVVLHGDATRAALSDEFYASRFGTPSNPNLPLIRQLQELGVEVIVCGQALNYKGFARTTVAKDIPVATAALTAVLNRQMRGFAVLQVP